MDTSETYIKMCEKAEEIQEQYHNFNDDKCFRTNPTTHYPAPGEPHIVWLPRQDQLQEMVSTNYWSDIERFSGFCKNKLLLEPLRNIKEQSMEQLWLAFVMKEKYGKYWNGNDWVKET